MSKVRIENDRCMETSVISTKKGRMRDIVAFCTNDIVEWFANQMKVSGHVFMELSYFGKERVKCMEDVLVKSEYNKPNVPGLIHYKEEYGYDVRVYHIKTSFLPPHAIGDHFNVVHRFELARVLTLVDSKGVETVIGIQAPTRSVQDIAPKSSTTKEVELNYFKREGVIAEASRTFKGHTINTTPTSVKEGFTNLNKDLERDCMAYPDFDPIYWDGEYVQYIKDTYGLVETTAGSECQESVLSFS